MTGAVTEPRPLRVAVLGCGVVGSEVVRLLLTTGDELAARVGAPLELAGVAVRRVNKVRELPLDPGLLTTDAAGLAARPDVDLVVEVVGGLTSAREWIHAALARGASVVTANKALLAERGAELYAAAERSGADLFYEAAVAGAIPIVRPLRESLVGDSVHRVMGIVNGTTNFILSRMEETGARFAEALDEATALGYAEADPTADVDGFDAAAKAAILASLAFHTNVTAADVHREGIAGVTSADVSSARARGAVVKLLAIAERSDTDGSVGVRVHPAMIPRSHPLAGVREAYNAVFVEGAAAGQLMFYGKGAGGAPTASAVLGDLVAVARRRLARSAAGGAGPARPGAGQGDAQGARPAAEAAWAGHYAGLRLRDVGETVTRYHISLDVADKAGVLANVAQAFAAHDVSIRSVRQEGQGDDAALVLVTHSATDRALSDTVDQLRGLDVVRRVASVMRVEGETT